GSAMITASNSYNVAMTNSAIATLSSAVSLAGASSSVGLVVNSSSSNPLILSGTNTYTGTTTITNGSLQLGSANAITGAIVFGSTNATLDLGGYAI
ncbi:hypothetical protein G6706_09575, partial [Polynucleobacter paneuropaeus]|nr:hypothetical protein [Polynucleobacter paneuropaeus]MBT8555681.1 hypothetical protein [Polynucleobacter paneuropaeus]MBT8560958.1 hypothetical protein [Polynucleobacter paneuropaeus]MBT8562841.1 hypothetical protein [Polynucleobacter paneuropaeus]